MVNVRYWQGCLAFESPRGYTLGDMLKGLAAHTGVPPGTTASVNGVIATAARLLRDGDVVELTRPPGRKGMGRTWTVEAFAAEVGVDVEQVRAWIERGLGVLPLLDGSVRITETAVDEFVERCRRQRCSENLPAEIPHAALALPSDESEPTHPTWHEDGRLVWGNVVLREYGNGAANQILILEAFERQSWPPAINNPFAKPEPSGKPKSDRQAHLKKLRDTVGDLNEELIPEYVRFRTNGRNKVMWVDVRGSRQSG